MVYSFTGKQHRIRQNNGIYITSEMTLVCTERLRSPYTEHGASGLHNLTPLEGEERFIQAQDQYMLPPHVHTPMNDTRTRDVTRKRRQR